MLAAAMNPAGKLYIKTLFDRFKKVHHQMMGDVESSKSEHVLVVDAGVAGPDQQLSATELLDRHFGEGPADSAGGLPQDVGTAPHR